MADLSKKREKSVTEKQSGAPEQSKSEPAGARPMSKGESNSTAPKTRGQLRKAEAVISSTVNSPIRKVTGSQRSTRSRTQQSEIIPPETPTPISKSNNRRSKQGKGSTTKQIESIAEEPTLLSTKRTRAMSHQDEASKKRARTQKEQPPPHRKTTRSALRGGSNEGEKEEISESEHSDDEELQALRKVETEQELPYGSQPQEDEDHEEEIEGEDEGENESDSGSQLFVPQDEDISDSVEEDDEDAEEVDVVEIIEIEDDAESEEAEQDDDNMDEENGGDAGTAVNDYALEPISKPSSRRAFSSVEPISNFLKAARDYRDYLNGLGVKSTGTVSEALKTLSSKINDTGIEIDEILEGPVSPRTTSQDFEVLDTHLEALRTVAEHLTRNLKDGPDGVYLMGVFPMVVLFARVIQFHVRMNTEKERCMSLKLLVALGNIYDDFHVRVKSSNIHKNSELGIFSRAWRFRDLIGKVVAIARADFRRTELKRAHDLLVQQAQQVFWDPEARKEARNQLHLKKSRLRNLWAFRQSQEPSIAARLNRFSFTRIGEYWKALVADPSLLDEKEEYDIMQLKWTADEVNCLSDALQVNYSKKFWIPFAFVTNSYDSTWSRYVENYLRRELPFQRKTSKPRG